LPEIFNNRIGKLEKVLKDATDKKSVLSHARQLGDLRDLPIYFTDKRDPNRSLNA